jgi:hypothetical protein
LTSIENFGVDSALAKTPHFVLYPIIIFE